MTKSIVNDGENPYKSDEFELCKKCHKNNIQKITKTCRFCQDATFSQRILCDLVRQNHTEENMFDCQAFQPMISVVSSNDSPSVLTPPISQENQLNTDPQKWFKAYAIQQLKQDPDQVYAKLKYHLCLVTKKREPVFSNPKKHLAWFTNILQDVEAQFENTLIRILWLDIDHAHIYIDSTPDYAIYNIATNITDQLDAHSPEHIGNGQQYCGIWETGFFGESIG